MAKPVKDDLADVIAESLNNSRKDGLQVAFILQKEDSPTDLTDFISTGASLLDLAISNRPNGGIACGRITELQGLEGAGKSLIAAHMIADVQKRGGMAVLIDTENAVNEDFFKSVGVDWSKLVYSQISTVEEVFEAVTNIIETIRKKDKKRLVLIVVDSLAAASTEQEMEADYTRDGYATGKAIIISKALRKITNLIGQEKIALVITQQLRQKLNAPAFADPYTTPGGKSLGFHASTRVRLSLKGKIKNADDVIIGVEVKANVIKSRLGPPYRTAEFEIYFDRGIDDAASWLEALKKYELAEKDGHKWIVRDQNGKKHSVNPKDWAKFLTDDEERKKFLYNQICEHIVMSYQSNGISIATGGAELVESEGEE